ncbi:guanylate cyclase 32E [Bacillus rossius redtenbacheri]|uniref:guanylate cyclase 32E n=1 Tax=Bacillus rossius redtenbacheri TaxID=93214 RepID=UPI002FDE6452
MRALLVVSALLGCRGQRACPPVVQEEGHTEAGASAVTVGFLAMYSHAPVELGAMPLAVSAVNQDPRLLPHHRLHYLPADIGGGPGRSPGQVLALQVMTQMRDNGTVAFIGPGDTCRSEALVAAAWNLPMISYKCADTRVSDKEVYFTFARTLPPSSKVSKSVVALLRAFSWDQFVLVASPRSGWVAQVRDAIKALCPENQLTVTAEHDLSESYLHTSPFLEQLDHIVADTYRSTRVYLFLGEHYALVDFVDRLQQRRLLDTGEYVVVSVDDLVYDPGRRLAVVFREYLDPHLSQDSSHRRMLAFRSVLKLTPSSPRNPAYKQLSEQIRKHAAQPPFCVPFHRTVFDSITVPVGAAHLYDAVMVYARALTEVLQDGGDARNGTAILQRICNRSYRSVQGHDVFIDANGDAEGNYTVVAMLDDAEANTSLPMSMQPVGYFRYNHVGSDDLPVSEFRYLDEQRPFQWARGRQPRAEPRCGFRGEKCVYRADWRVVALLGVLFSAVAAAAVLVYKHYRYEQKLACLLWKVDMKDVTFIPTEAVDSCGVQRSMVQVCRSSMLQASGAGDQADSVPRRAYTRICLYKGAIVAFKPVHKRHVDITRGIRLELKQIREARHENLVSFVGACVDPGKVCVLTAYCARGSLEDVLANRDLHLDAMFVSSLVADILKGMIYIHDSDIISHGNLRSSNCLVDSRWILQITDFGLHEFKAGQEEPDWQQKQQARLLSRAPELLRSPYSPARGSQKGDVYSFAFVLYELVGRAGPWGANALPPAETVSRVRAGGGRPWRPPLDQLDAAPYISRCVRACWHEDPDLRPDFRLARVMLSEMQHGLKPNIFDNMLAIMEKYAYNLEGIVQERTNQLMDEKKKSEALLHRMLPKSVADALKRGEPVEAESFDCVTIYFSDIVGFTELSALSTPLQVVELLNDLYTCCDSIISHYDVYKVETIGDAYMVASGLPERNGDRHAGEVASMALHLLSAAASFHIRHRPGEQLRLRIGIHSGQCVAGVVGLRMPRYCLFGDTVNTASRMESSGQALKIHISQATARLLDRLGGYVFEERGLVAIKGKGEMLTYWLISEDPAHRMERIRDDLLGATLATFCSDRPSGTQTPDLLRGPAGSEVGLSSGQLGQLSQLSQLHLRAVQACAGQRPQV